MRLVLPARVLFGEAYLAADIVTPVGTATITTLLSITARTRGGSSLAIEADFFGSNVLATGGVFFFLNLDAVRVPQSGSGAAALFVGGAITKRVAVAAGSHTVILQFRSNAVATAQARVRPLAQLDAEHASLVVWEEFA